MLYNPLFEYKQAFSISSVICTTLDYTMLYYTRYSTATAIVYIYICTHIFSPFYDPAKETYGYIYVCVFLVLVNPHLYIYMD